MTPHPESFLHYDNFLKLFFRINKTKTCRIVPGRAFSSFPPFFFSSYNYFSLLEIEIGFYFHFDINMESSKKGNAFYFDVKKKILFLIKIWNARNTRQTEEHIQLFNRKREILLTDEISTKWNILNIFIKRFREAFFNKIHNGIKEVFMSLA